VILEAGIAWQDAKISRPFLLRSATQNSDQYSHKRKWYAFRHPAQPLDPSQASGLAKVSRMDLVHSVLNNPALGLLAKLKVDYTLQPYTFGDELREMTADDANDWVNTIAATEPLTRIGDAVMDALSRMRGQPSTGIFLITDGQSNSGRSIVQAAEQAKLEGVPLFIYGVGIDQPKDIIVSDLFTRDVAFVKDSLPVSVRVRSPGFAGQSADVVLRLGDKTVDTEHITFDASAEQVVVMKFTPSQKGTYTLKASIDPRPDEASKDNNEASQPLKVVDDKIKVLYVERQPRWEFKYLVAMLMRDRRVDFKTLLLEADPSVTEGENSPFLKEFPTDADALTKFDLIILGDVDPRTFTEVQLTAMQHWVQQGGGGLLFIAGRQFNPWAYPGTPLADLLPVDVAEQNGPVDPPTGATDRPIHVQLTPAGRESQALRLTDNEQSSAQAWENLPPIWWEAPVFRAKPGADVLAIDPAAAHANRLGKIPLIVLAQPGLGQVMFVGTDNTWRWRKNFGDRSFVALWGQIVQRLSLPHLLGGSKKTQISTDQQKYSVGQKITVVARLYDDALKPIDVEQVQAFYQLTGGQPVPLTLRIDGGQKGIYRGEFVAPAPGNYECWVERDDKTRRDFSIVQSQVELEETAMNERGLRDMAATTGGQFFREEDLFKLPEVLRNKSEMVQRTEEIDLWSTWIYLGMLFAVVASEWIVRKISTMK
jgi:hypothetical protein